VQLLEPRTLLSASFPEFVDPNPATGNGFGTQVLPLSTGNVVITSPGNNSVYLFNGSTGALISTLTSTHSGDFDLCTVTAVGNGNFVVSNPTWQNGSNFYTGAVTWGSGFTGVNGVIGASNSLIGTQSDDLVGYGGITVLPNGNYLVDSWNWSNGSAFAAGAVTFGRGSTGVSGTISTTNSLIGTHSNDMVGYNGGQDIIGNQGTVIGHSNYGITVLSDGNYVVSSIFWNSGLLTSVGAVTWGNRTSGVRGTVSAFNSYIGASSNDEIGSGGVFALANGSYVISSPSFANGAVKSAGAATWLPGSITAFGIVTVANSLVGVATNDQVSSGGITALTNGNYVVNSPNWANGSVANAGAATWGSGTAGVFGPILVTNSLVGSTAGDLIGNDGVFSLPNGNYVVDSSTWSDTGKSNVGAVTFGSGTVGTSGAVGAANSLIGSTINDYVGGVNPATLPFGAVPTVRGVSVLANGNYAVISRDWNNGAAVDAGAVTWVNGTTGLVAPISAGNSLVGSTSNDEVGSAGVTKLGGNAYLVFSPSWSNGAAARAGAVTFSGGVTGITGAISAANSLIGSSVGDQVGSGGVTILTNGNYVISSSDWSNAKGAATWGSGSTGVKGAVNSGNSLVGSTSNDGVSSGGVVALPNGNYVVDSENWNNGAATRAGAVTWGNGLAGITGAVTSVNSLVGSTKNDQVGAAGQPGTSGVVALGNGNYVVKSPFWSNGSVAQVGAVTLANGTTGTTGNVTFLNSLVGSTKQDEVGYGAVIALPNNNYLVDSPFFNNTGTIPNAGAVTLGSGTVGITGGVSAINSIVGFQPHATQQISDTIYLDKVNQNFLVAMPDNGNGRVAVGSMIFTPPSQTLALIGLNPSSLTYAENNSPTLIASTITVIDPNSSTLKSATIQFTANYQNGPDRLFFTNTAKITGNFSFATGTLTLTGVDTLANYTAALRSITYWNISDAPSTLPRTISITVSDATSTSKAVSRSILVSAINDAPLLSNVDPSVLSYNIGSAPIAVAPTILCADADNDFLPGATIQITSNYQKTADKLTFVNTTKITSIWDVTTGTLTLLGTDTVSNYRTAMRSILFSNNSLAPSVLTRTISFSATDGSLSSNVVTRKVVVNVPPKLTNIEGSALSYTRGAPGLAVTSSLTVSGVDTSLIVGAVLQISSNYQIGDQLVFTNTAKIIGTWNSANATLTLTGNATDLEYQNAMRSVQFRNLSTTTKTLQRIVTFTVSDGSLNSNTAQRMIAVK